MHGLLDGDEAIFKASAITNDDIDWETGKMAKVGASLEDCKRALVAIVTAWCIAAKVSFHTMDFSFVLSPTDRLLFRRGLDATYKSGRSGKPEHYAALEEWARGRWPIEERPGLEADDVMGLLQTPETIIVSQDKDMKTVPGRLYQTHLKKATTITPERADWWWMMQTLMGDSTDGFPGCTGCGPKGAEEVLADRTSMAERWPAVVNRFTQPKTGKFRGTWQTPKDAIQQATLSRILRPGEYDPKTGAVVYSISNTLIEFNAHDIAQ